MKHQYFYIEILLNKKNKNKPTNWSDQLDTSDLSDSRTFGSKLVLESEKFGVFLAVNADVVLKGTNVDGVYDCQSRNGNNVTFEHISFRDCATRGFSAMDMTAMSMCEENGIPG